MYTTTLPISPAAAAALTARLRELGRPPVHPGRCPGCVGDPDTGAPLSPHHTERCVRQYERCPLCGAAYFDRCLHRRARPASDLTRHHYPTAAWYCRSDPPPPWLRWPPPERWDAYDGDYRYLGHYQHPPIPGLTR